MSEIWYGLFNSLHGIVSQESEEFDPLSNGFYKFWWTVGRRINSICVSFPSQKYNLKRLPGSFGKA